MKPKKLSDLGNDKGKVCKLDDLKDKIKSNKRKYTLKNIFTELGRFTVVLITVLVVGIGFVNFNLFYSNIKQAFTTNTFASDISIQIQDTQTGGQVSMGEVKKNIESSNKTQSDNFERLKKNRYKKAIEQKFSDIQGDDRTKDIYEKNLKKYLKNKSLDYEFSFNTLPPDNRVIIPSTDIEAPIVKVDYASAKKIQKGDFEKELFSGVVKYPFTANPTTTGNMMIFGHTSYYWWKDNPYGQIFSKMPRLSDGDKIQVVWEGKKYTYKIFRKRVSSPQYVGNEYEKYKDGKYITLMGCYPIGTDAKRMLIFGKQI